MQYDTLDEQLLNIVATLNYLLEAHELEIGNTHELRNAADLVMSTWEDVVRHYKVHQS